MTVIVIECASDKLRGTLTKWLMEVKPGVLVGNPNNLIRQKLWEKVQGSDVDINALMLYSDNTEQGYTICSLGCPTRRIVNFDGSSLIAFVNEN